MKISVAFIQRRQGWDGGYLSGGMVRLVLVLVLAWTAVVVGGVGLALVVVLAAVVANGGSDCYIFAVAHAVEGGFRYRWWLRVLHDDRDGVVAVGSVDAFVPLKYLVFPLARVPCCLSRRFFLCSFFTRVFRLEYKVFSVSLAVYRVFPDYPPISPVR